MSYLAKKAKLFSVKVSRFLVTPLGVIMSVGVIVLLAELVIMQVLFVVIPSSLTTEAPTWLLNALDATILTVAVAPALYFLVLQRMREDTEKLTKITEATQDAIIVMGDHDEILFWNPAAETIFGYSEEEAIGQNLHKLVAPQKSLNAFEHNIAHFRETGQGPILERVREVVAKRKEGEEFPVELSVSALYINGKWSAVGVVRDVTLRKKRELELMEANKNLKNKEAKEEALLASLGEGMIATDNTGKIIAVNRVAEEMLGWKGEEILNKVLVDIIPAVNDSGNIVPAQNRICVATATSEKCGGTLMDDTMSFVKKDGNHVPVAVTTTPVILNNECSGAVIIFRDITNEKELEKTRRDLLSLASHQLRTPLSGTKWLIETLQRGIHGTLTSKQEEYLGQIYKINEQMTNLVRDMLGVLRMEGDITPIKKEQVSLATLFGLIFETLEGAAKSKNISLAAEKTQEYMVEADPLLLRTVLECLVSNAINYSNPAGSVKVSVQKTADEFIFAVQDSGIGIPHDEQRQIFQRFYRASNAKTFDTRGTGLGLYIAATLTQKMGGQISFESEKDKGSTFYLHLPHKKS